MKTLVAAGAALALAFGVGTAHAAVVCGGGPCDSLLLQSGGTTITFNQTDESHEFYSSQLSFPVPNNFVSGTIYLTEPGSSAISDGFTLVFNPNTNHIDAYFISDGADASEWSTFLANVVTSNIMRIPETGNWQDVSSFFGQPAGFSKIQSVVPEPGASNASSVDLSFCSSSASRRFRVSR
jgi:hypothetical protein